MDNASDDGDPATSSVTVFKFLFLLCVSLASCQQLQEETTVTPIVQKPALQQVHVVTTKTPRVKSSKKKKIYLTFDDGPNRGTRNVLHIVQDEGIPVTFFLVGEHAFASVGQSQAWDSLKVAKHIALCNHSFTHAHNRYNRFYQQPDSVVADFKKAQDSLQLTNNIVRTPGRNIWRIDSLQFTDINKSKAAADSLQKAGFAVMGWDIEWHYDHKTMSVTHSAEELIRQIDSVFQKGKTRLKDHLVILAHDQVYCKSSDSFQLRQLVQQLKQREAYELALATQYPGTESRAGGIDTALRQ